MAEKNEKKDLHRAMLEELGRQNTMYTERPWEDWKPSTPPKLDHFTHEEPGTPAPAPKKSEG